MWGEIILCAVCFVILLIWLEIKVRSHNEENLND